MKNAVIDLHQAYIPSEDVVARIIEGQLILVPLVAGPPETEGELYSLNDTGKIIWDRLDSETSVNVLAEKLANDFAIPVETMRNDIVGLLKELLLRHIVRPA